ncbi:zinc-binding alcohol dehydrogenase [Paenibacillus sp. GCM10027626]|uniref:zinc-dependent alcohol dehydrogenase n=1 Tax=Paenibacillus sp. GCM10027626 TaxID=3273411 RepID=UPI003629EA3F
MKRVTAQQGEIVIADAEQGAIPSGHVRIRTAFSAISPGTEMTILRNSANRQEGMRLGYSAAGIVEAIGEQVSGIEAGQQVACYGAPYVGHAEYLTVPSNLVAVVPEQVKLEEAAFAGLGAIAIHALRTADLRFGESAVVVGLGILGQMIAQIASAAAVRVAGLDLNSERVEQLRRQGIADVFDDAEQLTQRLPALTGGYGVDTVILCASGSGEALINQALTWIRNKGKIVIVGDLTTEFSREAMFIKEAEVLISRAGGPGRYDKSYERDNRDYPIGFVRWTEGRNVGAYIQLLAEGRISVAPLISDVYPLAQAAEAYERYRNGDARILGTLLQYGS